MDGDERYRVQRQSAKDIPKRKRKNKSWIIEDTLKPTEEKQNAFLVWQADRTNVYKKRECKELFKYVRHAVGLIKRNGLMA